MSDTWQEQHQAAGRLARQGKFAEARAAFERLRSSGAGAKRLAVVANDLGTLDALEGKADSARRQFLTALQLDRTCVAAADNLRLLHNGEGETSAVADKPPGKVAVLSFLFNWPSTGGGIVHTVELARFLREAGFDVRLFGVRYEPWGIGRVEEDCPFPVDVIPFATPEWSLEAIKDKFRAAIDGFAPETVIVTDAWNIKPHLVEALDGYRVLLRMQAQECLCPLNNLRLLPQPCGLMQCPDEQLSNPAACRRCLVENGMTSGDLHRLERELSHVDQPDYHPRLVKALQSADAVLVHNPQIAETLRPYCRRVEVVTWGMDPARFPWPLREDAGFHGNDRTKRILLAGLTREFIKGYSVLQDACAALWERRQDFQLVVTDDLPAGHTPPFVWGVGWQSQDELPRWYRATDVTVVPTLVQDGLSRTSVEAMASGRPVLASRIGGLPFTVEDGRTGLLFEPGNSVDLAEKLARLLDDAELRRTLGTAGRAAFEARFQWPEVIERQYRPLLEHPAATVPPPKVNGATKPSADSAVGKQASYTKSEPLRILFLANFSGFWNNPAAVAKVLEELGHRVTRRHEFAVPNADALLDELDPRRYDCLLFSKGRLGAVTPEEVLAPDGDAIVEVLTHSRVPAFMWYVDRVLGFDPQREAWVRRVASLCRVAFVTDGPLVETGWANFRVLRQGIFRHMVRPVEFPEEHRRDVAFVGSVYGSRERELAPVRDASGLDQITGVSGPQLSEVLNRYRIILGPRFPSTPHYWSDRVYLVLGHGGFFLAPEIEGMREEGLIPGTHYAPLADDPVADVRYWLDHPEERHRIARAGQELVLERMSYHERLRDMCRVIRESLANDGAMRIRRRAEELERRPAIEPTVSV